MQARFIWEILHTTWLANIILVKRVNEGFRSTTLFFILLLVGLFIPGLNLIVLVGVPILGILENFFDLKKRKKE